MAAIVAAAAKFAILASLLAAARIDFARLIIPNRTVVVVAVCGLLLRLASPDRGLVWLSLLVALGMLMLLGLASRAGWLGGGDAKLIAATTLAVPAAEVVPLLLHIAVAGGLIAAAVLIAARFSRGGLTARWAAAQAAPVGGQEEPQPFNAAVRATPMAYGPAILLGLAWHWLWGVL